MQPSIDPAAEPPLRRGKRTRVAAKQFRLDEDAEDDAGAHGGRKVGKVVSARRGSVGCGHKVGGNIGGRGKVGGKGGVDGGENVGSYVRQLKRGLAAQAKQIQQMQAMILENQSILLGAHTVPPEPPPTRLKVQAAKALAARVPAEQRGEMAHAERCTLAGRITQLPAADMVRALEIAGVAEGENTLDLKTMESARLWQLRDLCEAALVGAPGQRRRGRPRKARAPATASKPQLLEATIERTEHRLAQIRAAREALGADVAAASHSDAEETASSMAAADEETAWEEEEEEAAWMDEEEGGEGQEEWWRQWDEAGTAAAAEMTGEDNGAEVAVEDDDAKYADDLLAQLA